MQKSPIKRYSKLTSFRLQKRFDQRDSDPVKIFSENDLLELYNISVNKK